MRIDERRPNLIASDAAPFASRGSALRSVTGHNPNPAGCRIHSRQSLPNLVGSPQSE